MNKEKSKLACYLEENCIHNVKFAKKIGITHTTLMKYIRGTSTPTIALAAIIQQVTEGKVKITDWVKK